jgi:response regulator RpfG family c-di-GMP phosphodiesterase
MSTKVLCVDDDPNVLSALQRNLRKQFDLHVATGGDEALERMKQDGPFAVIVADMQMPGMNGVQFLSRARQLSPDSVRIMLTGNADQATAVRAVNEGQVSRFLTKPCDTDRLAQALRTGIEQYRLIHAERDLLENTLNGSIKALTDILSLVAPVIFGRALKLKHHMRGLAQSVGIRDTWELEAAAMLSQTGYATVPAGLLEKEHAGQDLTDGERDMLQRIPQVSSNLLANIPRLENVARIVLHQHKHFDGSGFPADDVAGERIPIGSRLLKVLIDYLELHARWLNKSRALEHMQKRSGWYDPRILDAAFVHFDVYLNRSATDDATRHAVGIQDLRPGQILLTDVKTAEGALVMTAGIELSPMLIERLKNLQQLGGLKEPVWVTG